jgi:hypothetical protein
MVNGPPVLSGFDQRLHREVVRTMADETVVNMVTLGGIVYVATVANVYRVEGDRLVRLSWPKGPARRGKKEA